LKPEDVVYFTGVLEDWEVTDEIFRDKEATAEELRTTFINWVMPDTYTSGWAKEMFVERLDKVLEAYGR
jgi:hypothetical protein